MSFYMYCKFLEHYVIYIIVYDFIVVLVDVLIFNVMLLSLVTMATMHHPYKCCYLNEAYARSTLLLEM